MELKNWIKIRSYLVDYFLSMTIYNNCYQDTFLLQYLKSHQHDRPCSRWRRWALPFSNWSRYLLEGFWKPIRIETQFPITPCFSVSSYSLHGVARQILSGNTWLHNEARVMKLAVQNVQNVIWEKNVAHT